MKRLFIILALSAGLYAQETRREATNTSSVASEDTKLNSDKIPDVYAVSARFERVVIFRFKFDTDLLAGIEKMVKQEKIRNAVILAGTGSVRGYHVHQVSNRSFPSKNMFVKDPTAPADLINMNGFVVNGRVHAHVTLASPDKAFGGHLEPGTAVFTFAVVTVGILNDEADLSRMDDKSYR